MSAKDFESNPPHDNLRAAPSVMMGHPARSADPGRATQSFVGTLSGTWHRPSLTAIEVAWRWSFGAPALLLVLYKLAGAFKAATSGTMKLSSLGLDPVLMNDPVGALSADPMGASGKFAHALALMAPEVRHFAGWLVPLLLVGWVVQSSVGRTMLLHRAEPAMRIRIGTVMGLHAIRVGALACVFYLWFALLSWAARTAVMTPIAEKTEPNLVLFCGMVIVSSLGIFTAWAFVSWIFHIAPLLAMLRGLGIPGSLGAALSLGPVRPKLMEINLVLGIVKIALIVLAMVFSATPLPFETVTTPTFLAWWWFGVGLLYLLWSDFFHVARLIGYLSLENDGK